MRKIIRVEQSKKSPLQLTWIINNICTNKCSYCPSNLHDGKNHHYDWARAREFFKILFERYPRIHCTVGGGEPSLSPFFREIVEVFHRAGHTIGVTSNAAKPAAYWAEISPFLNYICFSYHTEFPDPNFEEKIRAAAKHTLVTVRVMMHPKNWDAGVKVYKELFERNKNISVEAVRILPWDSDIEKISSSYTDEQLQWFNDNPTQVRKTGKFKFRNKIVHMHPTFYFDDGEKKTILNVVDYINYGMTDFKGYTCEIGLQELFVNFLGEVTLGNCDTNSIGRIDEPENIKWPTEPVVCDKSYCSCTTSVGVSKWSNDLC